MSKLVWGNESASSKGHQESFWIISISSILAALFFIFSSIASFVSVPMFGAALEEFSSPLSMIVRTIIFLAVINGIAVWRLVKLHRHWVKVGGNKIVLWCYQLVFVATIVVSNILLATVILFWAGVTT